MSLVLCLEHSCPWPREGLSSERLSLALASSLVSLTPPLLIRVKNSGGKSCRELAEIFSIGKSQMSQIMTRKAECLEAYEKNAPTNRKRVKIYSPRKCKMLMTLRLCGFNKLGGTTFQCLDHRVMSNHRVIYYMVTHRVHWCPLKIDFQYNGHLRIMDS